MAIDEAAQSSTPEGNTPENVPTDDASTGDDAATDA